VESDLSSVPKENREGSLAGLSPNLFGTAVGEGRTSACCLKRDGGGLGVHTREKKEKL